MQRNVGTPVELELPRFFPAQAKTEKSLCAHEPYRADHAMRLDPLGIDVIQLNDKLIGIRHRTSQFVIHSLTLFISFPLTRQPNYSLRR